MNERVKRKAVRKQILNHTSSVSCQLLLPTLANSLTKRGKKNCWKSGTEQAMETLPGQPCPSVLQDHQTLDCKGKDFLQGWFRRVCFMGDIGWALKTTWISKRPSNNLCETLLLVKAYWKPILNVKSVSLNVRLQSFQFFTALIFVKTGHLLCKFLPHFLLEHKCFLIREEMCLVSLALLNSTGLFQRSSNVFSWVFSWV